MSASRTNRLPWLALATMALLLGVAALLQGQIDVETSHFAKQKEVLLLSSPRTIKRLSLGYDSLLADVYWTRAVQYYGSGLASGTHDFRLLWPLLNITTTLDPKLIIAYRFGAIFLSEPFVGANRLDLAIQLVKRGIEANPENWNLNSDLAFLYYWRMKDYRDAAATYLDGSRKPGAPLWMKLIAARISVMGGSVDTSRMIWSEIFESTQDPSVRRKAAQELEVLKIQQDEQHLDELAKDYQERFGRYPTSGEELRVGGFVPGIPVDPEGYPYLFGANGKSGLNPKSPIVLSTSPRAPGASK